MHRILTLTMSILLVAYYILQSFIQQLGLVYDILVIVILMLTLVVICTIIAFRKLWLGALLLVLSFSASIYISRTGGLFKTFTIVAEGYSSCPTVCNDEWALFKAKLSDNLRGKFVAFNITETQGYVKRVHGVPGDIVQICDEEVFINGQQFLLSANWVGIKRDSALCRKRSERIVLGSDEYFLLGDNPKQSTDSRHFGVVKRTSFFAEGIYKYAPGGSFEIVVIGDDFEFQQ